MPTQLNPLEETLFKTWARAHGIDNHDDPSNSFDHRGVFKRTNGMIHPPGHLNRLADEHNAAMEAQDSVEQPDPYMAQAEMHGNELKARGDQAKLQAQFQMEDVKHQHAMELKKMELEFKAQQDQQKAAQAEAKLQADRQSKLQELMIQRKFAQEDQQTNRQFDMEDRQSDQAFQAQSQQADQTHQLRTAQADCQASQEDMQAKQQHDLKGKLLGEELARSRPQPGGGQPSGGSSGLQQAMMSRMMGQ